MKKEEINEGKKPIIVAQCSNCMLEFTTWMSDSNECPECEGKVNFMNTHETESKKECIHSESWIKGKEICNDCLLSPAEEKPQEGWIKEFREKFVRDDGLMAKYTWEGTADEDLGPNYMADAIIDFITSQIQSSQREALKKVGEFLTKEYGYTGKYFEPINPTHGNCCTCQECGRNHDDCVCENNRIYKFLTNFNPKE